MRIVLRIFAIGLVIGVLCLAVIAGVAWWRSPKTVHLKLDSAGQTTFHGVAIKKGGERWLLRAVAPGKKPVIVIHGETNDFRLITDTVERFRSSGVSVRADVSISPVIEMRKLATFADRLHTNGVPLSVRIAPGSGPLPQ